TVKADCDIPGVGAVTLHIEVVEKDMKNHSSLDQAWRRLISENPFSIRVPERFTRDLLAVTEEMSLTVSEHAQRSGRIKQDAEDSADREGEQGEP
ncbi:hypothetical protein ENH_00036340, partial [Eimeria necatrix]